MRALLAIGVALAACAYPAEARILILAVKMMLARLQVRGAISRDIRHWFQMQGT